MSLLFLFRLKNATEYDRSNVGKRLLQQKVEKNGCMLPPQQINLVVDQQKVIVGVPQICMNVQEFVSQISNGSCALSTLTKLEIGFNLTSFSVGQMDWDNGVTRPLIQVTFTMIGRILAVMNHNN